MKITVTNIHTITIATVRAQKLHHNYSYSEGPKATGNLSKTTLNDIFVAEKYSLSESTYE